MRDGRLVDKATKRGLFVVQNSTWLRGGAESVTESAENPIVLSVHIAPTSWPAVKSDPNAGTQSHGMWPGGHGWNTVDVEVNSNRARIPGVPLTERLQRHRPRVAVLPLGG